MERTLPNARRTASRPAHTIPPGADPRQVIALAQAQGVTLRRLDNGEEPAAHAIDLGCGIVATVAPDHEPSDEVAALLVDLRQWIGAHANRHGMRWTLWKDQRDARAAEIARSAS